MHTGVTVILPRHPKDPVKHSYAGLHVLNGMGEVTGAHVVHELGLISAVRLSLFSEQLLSYLIV